MLQPTIQNINKEFDTTFAIPKNCPDFLEPHLKELIQHNKTFLNSSLKQLLVALLDELKTKEKVVHFMSDHDWHYNQALTEFTQIINKKIEELKL